MERREFLKSASSAGAFALIANTGAGEQPTSGATDRERWITVMRRLADPVLTNLAQGTLKASMPVEQAAGVDRQAVDYAVREHDAWYKGDGAYGDGPECAHDNS